MYIHMYVYNSVHAQIKLKIVYRIFQGLINIHTYYFSDNFEKLSNLYVFVLHHQMA